MLVHISSKSSRYVFYSRFLFLFALSSVVNVLSPFRGLHPSCNGAFISCLGF